MAVEITGDAGLFGRMGWLFRGANARHGFHRFWHRLLLGNQDGAARTKKVRIGVVGIGSSSPQAENQDGAPSAIGLFEQIVLGGEGFDDETLDRGEGGGDLGLFDVDDLGEQLTGDGLLDFLGGQADRHGELGLATEWRRGAVDYLDRGVECGTGKIGQSGDAYAIEPCNVLDTPTGDEKRPSWRGAEDRDVCVPGQFKADERHVGWAGAMDHRGPLTANAWRQIVPQRIVPRGGTSGNQG